MLFPNIGISNLTILELSLYAVTDFTCWNFDGLPKRGEGQGSEANMEKPTGAALKKCKTQMLSGQRRQAKDKFTAKNTQKEVEIKQGHFGIGFEA